MKSGTKILVIGKKGAGKTAYLEFLSVSIKEKGGKVGGFLCLNKNNSSKNEYHLVNLNDHQSWKLASRDHQDRHTIRYGDYYFNPAVFKLGNKILKESLACEVIFIDEYGPLERDRKGFYKGIRFLLCNYFGILIIATRPATVESIKQLILSLKTIKN